MNAQPSLGICCSHATKSEFLVSRPTFYSFVWRKMTYYPNTKYERICLTFKELDIVTRCFTTKLNSYLPTQLQTSWNMPYLDICLFCCFTSQVNIYGYGGTVSSPYHTFFLGKLEQAVNQYFVLEITRTVGLRLRVPHNALQ